MDTRISTSTGLNGGQETTQSVRTREETWGREETRDLGIKTNS